MLVQTDLPDAPGAELVSSLGKLGMGRTSRAILVTRPIDVRNVVTRLADWFFANDARRAQRLFREADRLVS